MSNPEPNIRSLLKVSFPLILAGLSSNLSIFVDRSILSHYDIDMMSQVTTVMNYCWAFFFAASGITWISKVFVGQYNGAKQYQKASRITWQMLFFSLSCQLLFFIIYYLAPIIIPKTAIEFGLPYFEILILFGCLHPMTASLASFFMGTYQTKILFSSLILSNVLNIVLDLLWIPKMGTTGAAYATVVAMLCHTLFLFCVFLNRYNREKYATTHIKFDFHLTQKAIKLGYPEALSHAFEMFAWAMVLTIISKQGEDYMIVSALAQNLFILFMFVYSELANAVKAMAANYIGHNERHKILKLLRSAITLHLGFISLVSLSLYLHPEWFVALFSLDHQTLALQHIILKSLGGVLLFMFFDGIYYLLLSLLSAYGDTFMSMIISCLNLWLFLVVPTYLLMNYTDTTPATHSLTILPLFGIISATTFALRHRFARRNNLKIQNL